MALLTILIERAREEAENALLVTDLATTPGDD